MNAIGVSINQNNTENAQEAYDISKETLELVKNLEFNTGGSLDGIMSFLESFKVMTENSISELNQSFTTLLEEKEKRTNQRLDNLDSSHKEIKRNVKILSDKVNVSDNSINELDKAFNAINESVKQLNTAVSNIDNISNGSVEAVSNLNSKIAEMNSIMSNTEKAIVEVKTNNQEIQKSILINREKIRLQSDLLVSLKYDGYTRDTELSKLKSITRNNHYDTKEKLEFISKGVKNNTERVNTLRADTRLEFFDVNEQLNEIKSQLVYPSTINRVFYVDDIPNSMKIQDLSGDILIGDLREDYFDVISKTSINQLPLSVSLNDLSDTILIRDLI